MTPAKCECGKLICTADVIAANIGKRGNYANSWTAIGSFYIHRGLLYCSYCGSPALASFELEEDSCPRK